jgi:hypothetical protein
MVGRMRSIFQKFHPGFSFLIVVLVLAAAWLLFNTGIVSGSILAQNSSEADLWEEAEAARLQEQLESKTLDAQTRKSLEEKLSMAELGIEERTLVGETVYAQGMPVPTPPASRAEIAFKTGILEGGEDILPPSEAVLINRWQGIVGQEYWQVFAGANGSDSTQGIVVRVITSQNRLDSQIDLVKIPPGYGALRVVSGNQIELKLVTESGKQYSLNPVTMEIKASEE